MQRRLLASLGLLGAVAGLIVLAYLLARKPPRLDYPETEQPQQQLPAPPTETTRAVTQKGTVKGKVINGLDKTPIKGATVIALKPYLDRATDDEIPMWGELSERARVKTDARGQFAIEDLPPDYWNLWIEKKGYSWTTLPRAKFAVDHTIELFPACSVRGQVVYEDDSPAVGVRIEYTPQGTHSEVFGRYRLEKYYITTDGDGRFEYTEIPQGKFTVEVYPQDHLPAPWKYEPPLKPGENRDLGVHRLERGFGMKVHVLWRGSKQPVEGIEVVVTPVGDPMPRTKTGQRRRTDSKGVALFSGLGGQVLPKPIFQIAANVDGVGPVMPDEQRLFGPNEDVTIYLRKDGIVKGKVLRPNGEPLERFFVGMQPIGFLTTQLRVWGENGAFKLFSVPEGTYLLHVRYGNLVDKEVKITAVAGQEVDAGTITLEAGAEIHGTVRNSNGSELVGLVRVHLARKIHEPKLGRDSWQTVGRAYCKKDGSYFIKGVPPGSFYIWPQNMKNASRTTDPLPIEIKPGDAVVQRDLVLYGDARLRLRFMDDIDGVVREVVRPPTDLVEKATGRTIRWMGEGHPLRPGSYTVYFQLADPDGVPQRYKWRDLSVQEGERRDPIEVRLYEIRNGLPEPKKD